MHIHHHRRRIHGILPFLKGILWTGRHTDHIPGTDRQTLEFTHPAWLDDIIIVTKGTMEKHEVEVRETMRKLENAGYRLHPKKCEFFRQEAEWVGHRIDQNGIRPLQDRLEAITKIDIPKNEKEPKYFLGAIQ